jgi:hypothetical protein
MFQRGGGKFWDLHPIYIFIIFKTFQTCPVKTKSFRRHTVNQQLEAMKRQGMDLYTVQSENILDVELSTEPPKDVLLVR